MTLKYKSEAILESMGLKQVNVDYGRLITTKAIKRGQIVITERAMAKTSFEYCNICFKPTTIGCPNCIQKYCSQSCLNLDSKIHKMTCGLNNLELDMLAKTIDALGNDSDQDLLLDEMVALLDKITSNEKHELNQLADLFLSYCKQNGDKSMRVILLSKFRFNNFIILDNELFEVGQGLYPLASKLNHSCCPNLVTLFTDDQVKLVATMDIEIGQELTISYIDTLSSLDTRRQILHEKYRFCCMCEYCDLNLPMNHTMNLDVILDFTNKTLFKSTSEAIAQLFSKYEQLEYLDYKERWEMIKDLKLSVQLYSKATSEMYRAIEQKDFSFAKEMSRFALFFLLLHYPPFHPITGIQAKMHLQLEVETPFLTRIARWAPF